MPRTWTRSACTRPFNDNVQAVAAANAASDGREPVYRMFEGAPEESLLEPTGGD